MARLALMFLLSFPDFLLGCLLVGRERHSLIKHFWVCRECWNSQLWGYAQALVDLFAVDDWKLLDTHNSLGVRVEVNGQPSESRVAIEFFLSSTPHLQPEGSEIQSLRIRPADNFTVLLRRDFHGQTRRY